MKGLVFCEFIELVEDKFSPEIADRLITECDLPSEGIYTAVGSYDHVELVLMVQKLSEISGVPVPDLIKTYGKHLFNRFTVLYPSFFHNVSSTFDLLDTVETHIHVEVRKLHADAELPRFETTERSSSTMAMIYRSNRPFADLAEGLIESAADYFNESIKIDRLDQSPEVGVEVHFRLQKE